MNPVDVEISEFSDLYYDVYGFRPAPESVREFVENTPESERQNVKDRLLDLFAEVFLFGIK